MALVLVVMMESDYEEGDNEMKKCVTRSLVVFMAGAVFQLAGCATAILQDVAINAVTEFVWDNDAVFDFFGDDGPGLLVP